MKILAYFDRYRQLKLQYEALTAELTDMQTESDRTKLLTAGDAAAYLMQMEQIEAAIRDYLPPDRPYGGRESRLAAEEQAFLRCRYLRGMTMEQTAEAMHISRDTVYRIRRRLATTERKESFSILLDIPPENAYNIGRKEVSNG